MASRVDSGLVGRAAKALQAHDQRNLQQKQQLVDRASPVLVTITLKADDKGNTAIYQQVQRPVRVPLPHSTYNSDEDSTCLFVKSEDAQRIREMAEEGLIHVAEVFSMNQVRKELERFGERKKVLSRHTHFYCDERITNYLYNSLGKVFLGKNKHPVPIRYSSLEALPKALEKAQASAYMHLKGVNISFKAGFTDTPQEQLVENVCQGLENAVEKINGKWRSIQAVHVKTPDSFAIPIYSAGQDETLDLFREMYEREAATAAKAEKKAKKATGKRTKDETKEEVKEEAKRDSAPTKAPASARKATPNKRAKVQHEPEQKQEEQKEERAPATPKQGKKAAEEKKAATTASKRGRKQQQEQAAEEEEVKEAVSEQTAAPESPVPTKKTAASASAKKATPSKAAGAKSAKKAAKEEKTEEQPEEEVPATPSRPKRARAASALEAADVPSTPATRTRARAAASAKKPDEATPAPSAKKQRAASAKKK